MTNPNNGKINFDFLRISVSYRVILFLILLLGLVLRLYDLINAATIEMDGMGYTTMAENFLKGEVLEALKDISHPLYPLFLSAFGFFIKDLELAGRLLSLISGMLLIYISFLFFFKRFFDVKKALLVSFFMAIHPYLIRYSSEVLTESLAIVLFTSAVFLFYKGWVDDDMKSMGLSGILLALTYLTKAEYIIYALPFSFLLLRKKRYSHIVIFLVLLFVFSFPYVYYIKMETGVWTITKKVGLSEKAVSSGNVGSPETKAGSSGAGLSEKAASSSKTKYSYASPFASITDLLKRAPFVAYNFILAVFPPFFVLVVLGCRRVDSSYRYLVVMIVVLHLIGRTVALSHSSLRYSLEFVPILLIFGVEGLSVLKAAVSKYKAKKILYYGAISVLIIWSVGKGLTHLHKGRVIQKHAGVYLSTFASGKKIVEQFPVATYYAKGKWVNINSFHPYVKDCDTFVAALQQKGVEFIIFDYRMLEMYSSVESCFPKTMLVKEFNEGEKYVRIYKLFEK